MKELILIQNELKAPKNQFNNFGKYKYRSQEDILEAVKPLLKKHECMLTISDEIKEVGGLVYVEASATIRKKTEKAELFNDGVTVTAQAGIDPNKKGMDLSQCFGSSSSYARKYALNGLFLIDDTKDSDSTNMHDKKKVNKHRNRIEILLRSSSLSDDQKTKIENKIDNLSDEETERAIEYLENNQRNRVQSGDNYGLSDINKQLDYHDSKND